MGTSAELYNNNNSNTAPAAAAAQPTTDAPAPPRGQWVFIPDFEEDQTGIAAGMAGTGLEPSGTRIYFDNQRHNHHNHPRHHAKHHKHGSKPDSDSDSDSDTDNIFSGSDSEMKRNFKDQMRHHKEQMKTQRRQMKDQHRQMKEQMRQQHRMHRHGPFGRHHPHDHLHHHGHHGHPVPPVPPMPPTPPMPQMPHMLHMRNMPPFGPPTVFRFGNGPSSSSVPTSTVPGVPFMFGFTSIPPFEALSPKQQEAADNGAEVIRVAESSEGWVCRETTKNGKAAYEFFKQESAKEKGKENNKSLHYHNNSAYRIATIDAAVNTRTAALLEVQAYPTIKLIQQGMVWTFRDSQNMTTSNIVRFASEDWKEYAWFNKLPTTWSVWFKLQLDLFNTLCGMLAALEGRMGALSTSASVANLISYTVLVGSVIGFGVLLPFGIVYLT
ncbi:hypothetical protein HDU81_011074 [Chytriomyces hyalinus]|nr:hypothetical protein HDU81_011074 [Chytriomyces hyalinus]